MGEIVDDLKFIMIIITTVWGLLGNFMESILSFHLSVDSRIQLRLSGVHGQHFLGKSSYQPPNPS